MSGHQKFAVLLSAVVLVGVPAVLRAQTSIAGSSLALKSSGSSTLNSAAYVGTYLTVPAGGATVSFTMTATESASGAGTPHVNLVIADSVTGFSVASTSATNYSTAGMFLNAGTYFVRAERDYAGNTSTVRTAVVNSLAVNTISGGAATFSNSSTDANALAAADTYIANYRKGSATVTLAGPGGIRLLPGTPVHVNLARIGFNFGTAIPGTSASGVNSYLGSNGTAQQNNYQSRLNLNFNSMAPENIGKWSSDEGSQDVVTMTGVDTMLNYAASHHMNARMHNVIWGNQQPNFINTLVTNAANGVSGAAASLRTQISQRIDYYVGTGTSAGTAGGDRDLKYSQIDVYNESYHTGSNSGNTTNYWSVYGVSGIADIYNEVAAQIAASGSTARTFVNEYNVLQNNGGNYAGFYATHINQLRNAGGNVGGIGVQYYPNAASGIGSGDSAHSAARIYSTYQALSTQGVPIELTEFGVGTGGTTGTVSQILTDSMRLTFGTPAATGFTMWGFQAENGGANLFRPAAALYTVNTSDWNTWTLTDAGKAWQDLLGIQDWDGNTNNAWNTNFTTSTTATGAISIPSGFYGDYYLSNQTANSLNAKLLPTDFTLSKGTTGYSQTLAKPPGWYFWKANGAGNWGVGNNWTDAPESLTTPSSAGFTAYFGSSATTYNTGTGIATTATITGPVAVTVSTPVVAGMLVFDSTNTYTLSGSQITLQGYEAANTNAATAAIYVQRGTHNITAPLLLASNTTITAGAGATLNVTDLRATAVGVTKAGPGMVVANTFRAGSLTITGGTARVASNSFTPSVLLGLPAVSPGAAMDLTNNNLIVYSGAGDVLSQVEDLLAAGLLMSSSAAVNPALFALGYADADSLGLASLDGTAVSAGATVVKFTYVGDTDLNGLVDGVDIANLIEGLSTAKTGWHNGDVNYDGVVNATDYALLISAYANQGAPLSQPGGGGSIPEPGTLALLAAPIVAGRRRR